MQKWVTEDWKFELEVTSGKAGHCRLGLETGDKFVFSYGCPEGICPRVMADVFTWCKVIRCGGDFTKRGEKKKYESTMAVNGSTVSSTPVMVGRILEALTM